MYRSLPLDNLWYSRDGYVQIDTQHPKDDFYRRRIYCIFNDDKGEDEDVDIKVLNFIVCHVAYNCVIEAGYTDTDIYENFSNYVKRNKHLLN